MLEWFEDEGWHLRVVGSSLNSQTPYSAWAHGEAEALPNPQTPHLDRNVLIGLKRACSIIADWAREDGHTVPPHPLNWYIGEDQ